MSARLAMDTMDDPVFRLRDSYYYDWHGHRHSETVYLPLVSPLSSSSKVKLFATSSLLLPIRVLATEPIVVLICPYVAYGFAIFFSLLAAVPLVFQQVYIFDAKGSTAKRWKSQADLRYKT